MIRDPSDGSVREKPVDGKAYFSNSGMAKELMSKEVLASTTSGLQTGSQKPENLARLDKSREWLKKYREAKRN
jgi:hypothetical protein